jgi:hypothetical protein
MRMSVHARRNLADGDRKTKVLGWVVTLVPRVGVIRPF